MADGDPASGGSMSMLDRLRDAKASPGVCTVAESKARGLWGNPNSNHKANCVGTAQCGVTAAQQERQKLIDYYTQERDDLQKMSDSDYNQIHAATMSSYGVTQSPPPMSTSDNPVPYLSTRQDDISTLNNKIDSLKMASLSIPSGIPH